MTELPDFLKKYAKTPEEILEGRVLPPPGKSRGGIGSGRLKFASAAALEYSIDLYFQRCEMRNDDGKIEEEPTVPGMVYAIGLSSRAAFNKYTEYGEDYKQVVDRAYLRLEALRNQLLLKGGSTTQAAIFDLKVNHKWIEKTEKEVTVNAGGTLADLLQALDGKVLRPVIDYEQAEEIGFEEVDETMPMHIPDKDEYAEPAQFDDEDDIC